MVEGEIEARKAGPNVQLYDTLSIVGLDCSKMTNKKKI
jgi:hypothetical protein